MKTLVQEPQGVGFYNINDGVTHYAKLEPTIAAYINSSDMGINASRDQDFGWRLEAPWVKRIKEFRRDRTQMQILATRNAGQRPTTVQILHYLYGEDMRNYAEELEEHEHPYEAQYQRDIAEQPSKPTADVPASPPSSDDESGDMADVIDDAVAKSEVKLTKQK